MHFSSAKTIHGEGFVRRYVTTAVSRNAVQKGPLPGCGADDVLQEVHLILYQELGEGYLERMSEALESTFQGSSEHGALKKAVRGALSKARSTVAKRKQRGLPQEVPLDHEIEDRSGTGVTLIDLTLDLHATLLTFTPLEQRIWQRSDEGNTLRQIEAEIGLPFQRIGEIRQRLIRKVSECLGLSIASL